MSGTKFEVSFDGDFARNCEFIVSLPIIEKDSRSSSGNCRFRPKRGCGESGESSEEEGRKQENRMDSFGRFFNNQEDLDDETSTDSDGETGIPSPQRKAAAGAGRREAAPGSQRHRLAACTSCSCRPIPYRTRSHSAPGPSLRHSEGGGSRATRTLSRTGRDGRCASLGSRGQEHAQPCRRGGVGRACRHARCSDRVVARGRQLATLN